MCARVCLCACVWGVMWRLIFYVVWCYDFLMCGVLVYIYIYFYYFWCVQQSACVCICFFTLLLFFLQFYYFCFTFMFFLHFYSFFFAFILYFALLYYFSLLLCLLNLQLTACMRQWLFALLVCFYVYLLCGKLWQQAVVFYVILIKFSGYQTPFFMHFLCTADFCFSFYYFSFCCAKLLYIILTARVCGSNALVTFTQANVFVLILHVAVVVGGHSKTVVPFSHSQALIIFVFIFVFL